MRQFLHGIHRRLHAFFGQHAADQTCEQARPPALTMHGTKLPVFPTRNEQTNGI